ARPLALEAADELREDPGADTLERAHSKRAAATVDHRADVGLGRVQPGDDRLGMAEDELARLGQVDRAWAAGALDQLGAGDLLEGRDLLADRRLGVAELGRRAAERPLLGDGLQRCEMA